MFHRHRDSSKDGILIVADLLREGNLLLSGIEIKVYSDDSRWYAVVEAPPAMELEVGSYQLRLPDGRVTNAFLERVVNGRPLLLGLGVSPVANR